MATEYTSSGYLGSISLGDWKDKGLLRNSRQIDYTITYKTFKNDNWSSEWLDPNAGSNLLKLDDLADLVNLDDLDNLDEDSVAKKINLPSLHEQQLICLKITVPKLADKDYNDTSITILTNQYKAMQKIILQIPYIILDTRVDTNICFKAIRAQDPTELSLDSLKSRKFIPSPDPEDIEDYGGICATIPTGNKFDLLTLELNIYNLFIKGTSASTTATIGYESFEPGKSYYLLINAFSSPVSEDETFPEDFNEEQPNIIFGKGLADKSYALGFLQEGLSNDFTWKVFSSSLLPTITPKNDSYKKKTFNTKEPLVLQWEGTHAIKSNGSFIYSDVSRVMAPYVNENNWNKVITYPELDYKISLFRVVLYARIPDSTLSKGYRDVAIKFRDENGQLLGDKSVQGHYENYNLKFDDNVTIVGGSNIIPKSEIYSVISQYEPETSGTIPKLSLTFYPEHYRQSDSYASTCKDLKNAYLYFKVEGYAWDAHIKVSYDNYGHTTTTYPTWKTLLSQAENKGKQIRAVLGNLGANEDMMPWRRTAVYYSPIYKIGSKNGTIKVKTDVDSWKDGTVWVKTANGWKEASNVYTKTADGWKESK